MTEKCAQQLGEATEMGYLSKKVGSKPRSPKALRGKVMGDQAEPEEKKKRWNRSPILEVRTFPPMLSYCDTL